MSANFLHGVETVEIDNGPRPIRLVKTAVVGLIGTAPIFEVDDAYKTTNTPVLILNDLSGAEYFGTVKDGFSIPQALNAISDQQVSGAGAAAVIVINVLDPARHKSDQAAQSYTFEGDDLSLGRYGISNLVLKNASGSATYVSGTDYVLDAANGLITRTQNGSIASGAVVSAAFTYVDPSKVQISEIIGATDTAGRRTGLQAFKDCFSLFGFWPKILIAPGYSPLNSVATELNVLAQALRAVAMVDAPVGVTFQQALSGRGPGGAINFYTSSERMILCYPHLKVYDTDSESDVLEPYSQRLAGVLAAKDLEKGYWYSPSNTEIQGIDGVERLLTSMINDPNSEANLLNEAGIVTTFNSYGTGIRTWGNRSAAWPDETHPKNFINVRRVADVIAESIEYSTLQFIDQPVNNAWIDAVVESVCSFMRTLVARGAIIDGRCWYDKAKNEATELALGHVVFSYDFMPPVPAERVTYESYVNIEMLRKIGPSTKPEGSF